MTPSTQAAPGADPRTVYEVIDWCRDTATSEADKGTKFERASRYFLKNDPLYQARFEEVWMWKDAPTNNGHDIGIDLVAKDAEDGTYWAIQCKCYDESSTLDYHTVSTFFGATGNKGTYGHNMLISTTERFSPNLDKVTREWATVRLFPAEMDEADVDWRPFLEGRETARREVHEPRPHQREAIDACIEGFERNDRGKLVMACGTGKTLTSLRLAEEMLGPGARVLFLAPSISLVGQTMRAWANQARLPLRCAVVCSDAKASDAGVDVWESSLKDLPYPATTDPELLLGQMREANPDGLSVVFSTYQSIQVVSDAQARGLGAFDLAICDEAHRTTGVSDAAGGKQDLSEFVKVHDDAILSAKKRLYMTATPRIYGDVAKKKAKAEDYEVSSMDDESVFGPEFFRLAFGRAVDEGLLTDYRVIALTVSEDVVGEVYQRAMAEDEGFEIPDAAKIVGCWKGLADQGKGAEGHPLKNAVAFCSTIAESKRIQEYFKRVVDAYIDEEVGRGIELPRLRCEIGHVDGGMDSAERKQKLKWLADVDEASEAEDPKCHILTNARCLSEGIDVPNLDAVMFLQPRKSQIDITQAVGRVMRRFEGKDYGYIILPIVVPAGMTAEQALDDNEPFQVVWDILKALRSHDERLEARINALPYDLGVQDGPVTVVDATPGKPEEPAGAGKNVQEQISFSEHALQEAVNAMVVRKCGTKVYWEDWARDIAAIAKRHIGRIAGLTAPGGPARAPFEKFVRGLRDSLNEGIREEEAVEMLAQHMITLPVFEALFQGAQFASSNPVSVAMETMVDALRGYSVETPSERVELFELYRSVEIRASSVKTDAGRQRIIKELYEKFFSQAFRATSEKMGIVYTPGEVVDYILHATDRLLRREFGQGLADEGVHILDPFTGTGTFVVNLLADEELMPAGRIAYKYANELHCNEILLLAYYIATINIEHAYHARAGQGGYVPFPGAVLTDTFQMYEEGDPLDVEVFVDNSERILQQMQAPINVIVGNPPYSAGQKSANDNNANESYPTLDARIAATYAARTEATNKNSLYDSYIRAFRWASDRIGKRGVVSFVTNGGWLDAAAANGFRKCLAAEFSSVYVFNLRGNQRTQGEQSRKEGGKIFGSGSRAPIAITMLVKNPDSPEHGVIRYYDIGDYLTREEKLAIVASSIDGEPFEWDIIEPDRHGDWLNQRDDSFGQFAPMGIAKYKPPYGMFVTWSNGNKTQRDAWAVNYSFDELGSNMSCMIDNFNAECSRLEGDDEADKHIDTDATKISWTRRLQDFVKKNHPIEYKPYERVLCQYRPFCKQWMYYDKELNEMTYQQPRLFPFANGGGEKAERTYQQPNIFSLTKGKGGVEMTYQQHPLQSGGNLVIDTSERGVFITNILPDLELIHHGQCFPLYWYEKEKPEPADGLFASQASKKPRYIRHDAITDEALCVFRTAYPSVYGGTHPRTVDQAKTDGLNDSKARSSERFEVDKVDMFFYVYGILHSPEYRRRFAANLQKEKPRIPLVSAFKEFAAAGRALADLHLNYETAEMWPLTVRGSRAQLAIADMCDPGPVKAMKWGKKRDPETGKNVDDHTTLIYNENLTYADIPERANDYKVNGRSPLEWMIDRYRMDTDKASGIVNDPNEYSEDPAYICNLVPRLVTVSMRTLGIIDALPSLNEIEKPANWPVTWGASHE